MLVKDSDTWKKIIRQGEGYIYNDFGTQFPGDSPTWNTANFNKLHRASCGQVKRMTHITRDRFTKHFFESREEAISWLERNRKDLGYTFCQFCNP
jgi:hypothetical protein